MTPLEILMSFLLTRTLADIQLLESWAPDILRQGQAADPADLREIITLRARTEESVAAFLDDQKGDPFFALLRADGVCAPLCHNLLYLPEDQALAAAAAVGGFLNPLSWYGVHAWEMTREAVYPWTDQFNQKVAYFNEVHPAEVLQAFEDLHTLRGEEYVQQEFYRPSGAWRPEIDPTNRSWMSTQIEVNRAAWRDWAGKYPQGFYSEEC